MGPPLPWLAFVAFGTLVAVALVVLGLRAALRAMALGYSVALLAGLLPIALRIGLPLEILPTIAVSTFFAMPGILLSVVGAALLHKLPAAQRAVCRVRSISIGVVLGTFSGFVAWSSVTIGCAFPMSVALILGAGAGTCWGILAPSIIRPNTPLQPTSGGHAQERGGSMGSAARG